MKNPQEIKVCFIQAEEMGVAKLQVGGVSYLRRRRAGDAATPEQRTDCVGPRLTRDNSLGQQLFVVQHQQLTGLRGRKRNARCKPAAFLEKEGILRVKNLFFVTDADQAKYDRILAAPPEL